MKGLLSKRGVHIVKDARIHAWFLTCTQLTEPFSLKYHNKFVAVEANSTTTLTPVEFGKLVLNENNLYDFVLFNFAERFANGWAVLGECKEKWVGISKARMQSISATDTDLTVVVRGEPNEMVTLTFVPPQGTSRYINC